MSYASCRVKVVCRSKCKENGWSKFVCFVSTGGWFLQIACPNFIIYFRLYCTIFGTNNWKNVVAKTVSHMASCKVNFFWSSSICFPFEEEKASYRWKNTVISCPLHWSYMVSTNNTHLPLKVIFNESHIFFLSFCYFVMMKSLFLWSS